MDAIDDSMPAFTRLRRFTRIFGVTGLFTHKLLRLQFYGENPVFVGASCVGTVCASRVVSVLSENSRILGVADS